jgi:hypothetical protein
MLQGVGAAVAGLFVLTLTLYWFVVCVKLYRYGARFPTGLKPWCYFRDLRAYKEILLSEDRPVTIYYVLLLLTWLLVALSLVLAVMYSQYQLELNQPRTHRRH